MTHFSRFEVSRRAGRKSLALAALVALGAATALCGFPARAEGPAPTVASGKTGTCSITATVNCIGFEASNMVPGPWFGLPAAVVADPTDASNQVLRLVKSPADLTWAGVTVDTSGVGAGTVVPVRFSSSKVITVRVFSPLAGEKIMLKAESTAEPSVFMTAEALTTQSNAWETLTFDFTVPVDGAYVPGKAYNRVSVFPHFGSTVPESRTYYFDEIRMRTANQLLGWRLVWADEFNVNGLPDASKWDYDTDRNRDGWYNDELQYYARDRLANAKVASGKLRITARKESLVSAPDWGGQLYTSARMVTRGKASWTYGRFEVRAKLPCGVGTWPAIWMLGTGGRWPLDGEIDIMEQLGRDPKNILGTVHTQSGYGGGGPGSRMQLNDACSAFHNYQLTWTADQITMGVDGYNYFTYSRVPGAGYDQWPFDQPQYLLLNIAIGGTLGGPVNDSIFPVTMQVDYVRVYQR